jgi:hypothetical protein
VFAGAVLPLVKILATDHHSSSKAASDNDSTSSSEDDDTAAADASNILQEASAALLERTVQYSSSNAAAVLAAGGVPCLPLLLSSYSGRVRKHAALATAHLVSQQPAAAKSVASSGGIPHLLQLLQESDAAMQEAAAAAVGSLASPSCASAVLAGLAEAGAIPALVQLLRNGCGLSRASSIGSGWSSAVSMSRANSMGSGLARNSSASSSTAAAPPATTSTPNANLVAQDWAAYALAQLAKAGSRLQSNIYAAGALEPLVRLLEVPSAQLTAANALGNLCANNTYIQKAILFAGAVPLLLAMLGLQQQPEVQLCAAAAIGNLAANNAGVRSELAAAGAAELLVAVLASSGSSSSSDDVTNSSSSSSESSRLLLDAKEWAAYGLSHVCKGLPDVQSAAAEAGAVVPLLQLLAPDSSPAAQQTACCALANLAADVPDIQAEIAEEGGIPALVQLLGPNHYPAVQSSAAVALWELVRHNPVNSMAAAAAGGIAPLARMLEDSGSAAAMLNVRHWAAHVLQHVAAQGDVAQSVQLELGDLEPLQQLAAGGRADQDSSSSSSIEQQGQTQQQQVGEPSAAARSSDTTCWAAAAALPGASAACSTAGRAVPKGSVMASVAAWQQLAEGQASYTQLQLPRKPPLRPVDTAAAVAAAAARAVALPPDRQQAVASQAARLQLHSHQLAIDEITPASDDEDGNDSTPVTNTHYDNRSEADGGLQAGEVEDPAGVGVIQGRDDASRYAADVVDASNSATDQAAPAAAVSAVAIPAAAGGQQKEAQGSSRMRALAASWLHMRGGNHSPNMLKLATGAAAVTSATDASDDGGYRSGSMRRGGRIGSSRDLRGEIAAAARAAAGVDAGSSSDTDQQVKRRNWQPVGLAAAVTKPAADQA